MAHSRSTHIRWMGLALVLALAPRAGFAQLIPEHLYFGLNRAIPCRIDLPEDQRTECAVEAALIEPLRGEILERTRLLAEENGRPPLAIDLAQAFPVLWTERRPRLLYAQLILDGRAYGSPVVLEPLITPRHYRDALTERVLDAFARRDAAGLTRLLALSERAKADMREGVGARPAASAPVFSGLRAYPLRDVMLETSEGTMRVALDPAAAPRTAFHFLQLVEGGFYEGVAFHRIINADAEGRPFIVQCGDPTGTGFGGSSDLIDFEPGTMPHDLGVLSMARRTDDPNSNGSQFFICLGREACAKLDGSFTPFARVRDGFDALSAIASSPVAPPDENEGEGIAQRPIHPPILEHARSVPAAPAGVYTSPKLSPDTEKPVER